MSERKNDGLSFSPELRKQVRYEARGRCEMTGQHLSPGKLQIHHGIPRCFLKWIRPLVDAETFEQFKDYIKSRQNAFALSGKAHSIADHEAIFNHVFMGFDKPLGIPVDLDKLRGRQRWE